MAPSQQPPADSRSQEQESSESNLAQAYRDLVRGEQTASALEANLSTLEAKLDAILAAVEATAREIEGPAADHKEEDATQNGTKPVNGETPHDEADKGTQP